MKTDVTQRVEITLDDALMFFGHDRARRMTPAALYVSMASYDRQRIARETGIELPHLGAVYEYARLAWAAMTDADRARDADGLREQGLAV